VCPCSCGMISLEKKILAVRQLGNAVHIGYVNKIVSTHYYLSNP